MPNQDDDRKVNPDEDPDPPLPIDTDAPNPNPAEVLKGILDMTPSPTATQWQPLTAEELDTLFPDYQVIKLLGRGGMGAVYQALQRSLDRPVAIKVLPPEFSRDLEFETRFRREAKLMARLNHPNIIQIYDFGQTESRLFYFVMEFVDGADLHQMIKHKLVNSDSALKLVSQVCEALQYAHDQGYIHRDIKPANILLNKDGLVKVGDFGLAKLVDPGQGSETEKQDLTMSGQAMGTANYIAPEQLDEDADVDHRADIYSLGVMFYEMLTGEVPRGAFAPPSGKIQIDVRIDDVVLKSMQEKPEQRYQAAKDVHTDVTTIRTNPRAVTMAAMEKCQVKRKQRSRKVWVIAGFGILLAVLAAACLILKPWENRFVSSKKSDPIVLESPSTYVQTVETPRLKVPKLETSPGKLRCVGQRVNRQRIDPFSLDISAAEGISDFIQVTAQFLDADFAALRANGEVVSNVPQKFKPYRDVIRLGVRTDSDSNLFYIDSKGLIESSQVSGTMAAGEWPTFKTPVVSASSGSRHGLLLLADTRAVPWGCHYTDPVAVNKAKIIDKFRFQPAPEQLIHTISVDVSGRISAVLKRDGSVLAWDDFGVIQLPVQLREGIVEIDIHYRHGIFARNQNGQIWHCDATGNLVSRTPIGQGNRLFPGSPPMYRNYEGDWRFCMADDATMTQNRHPEVYASLKQIKGLPPEAFYLSIFNRSGFLYWIDPAG